MTTRGGIGPNDDRFETIYRQHYARVWRYYRSCRMSDDEAHDLAQDAFKRVYERIDSIRGDNPWPFVESVARSVLYNHIRGTKAMKRSAKLIEIDDPELMFDPPAPAEPDIADREEAASRRKRLGAAVRELSEAQSACLRLRISGLSYEEIQNILGITLDAVKSRLRDAKKMLRERLGEKP